MVRVRRGVVIEARAVRPGVTEALVDVEGEKATALAYDALCGPVAVGDTLVLNTTAVALGLGTGGVHFVIAVERGRDLDAPPAGHAMKLRYTPLQVKVAPVEETHRDALDAFRGLEGGRVVAAGLHSAVAPALVAARAIRPAARTAFVMTDGGALPLAFSRLVHELRDCGLLDVTVTCGQAFGGDLEAVNLYSGIAAARAVGGADLVVVAMGPGNLGTASRLGFALVEVASVVNAVAALGGTPVVVPRLSFTDARERHRGVSHHSLTALSLALAPAEIVLPRLAPEREALVRGQIERAGLLERHRVVVVDLEAAEAAISDSPVPLTSMGRSFADDPDGFRAAAAAGVLAVRGSA